MQIIDLIQGPIINALRIWEKGKQTNNHNDFTQLELKIKGMIKGNEYDLPWKLSFPFSHEVITGFVDELKEYTDRGKLGKNIRKLIKKLPALNMLMLVKIYDGVKLVPHLRAASGELVRLRNTDIEISLVKIKSLVDEIQRNIKI